MVILDVEEALGLTGCNPQGMQLSFWGQATFIFMSQT